MTPFTLFTHPPQTGSDCNALQSPDKKPQGKVFAPSRVQYCTTGPRLSSSAGRTDLEFEDLEQKYASLGTGVTVEGFVPLKPPWIGMPPEGVERYA